MVTEVQKARSQTNSTSTTATFPSATTAGNLLVAIAYTNSNVGVLNVSGWTALETNYSGTGQSVGIFYKIADGSETTVTSNGSSICRLHIAEFSGLKNPVATDGSNSNVQSSVQSINTNSVTTTENDVLLVVAAANSTSSSGTRGWSNSFTTLHDDATGPRLLSGYRAVNTTGTYNSTATLHTSNSNSGALIIAFEAEPPPTPLLEVEQSKTGNAGAYDLSIDLAFDSNVLAGSCLVAAISRGAPGTGVASVTDTRGNTWTKIDDAVGEYTAIELWYTPNTSAGACTVTATSPDYHDFVMTILEVRGVGYSSVLDVYAPNVDDGYDNTHTSATTSATSIADAIAIAAFGFSGNATLAAGTGYTMASQGNGFDLYTAQAVEYKDLFATGAQVAGMTSGSEYLQNVSVIAVFSASIDPSGNIIKVKISGSFEDSQAKVKASGTFADYDPKAKISGTFQ